MQKKKIDGFPNYWIYEDGRVWSERNNLFIKIAMDIHGYRVVHLRNRKLNKMAKVHQLVCIAFNSPRPFPHYHCMHLDNNKLNNSPSNLKWGTPKENSATNVLPKNYQRGELNNCAKLNADLVREIRTVRASNQKLSLSQIAKIYNVSCSAIKGVVYGANWKHVE